MNPLSFSVGVKDEASKQLEAINKELNNLVSKLDSIKNIAISLGGDPAEAESLMKSLNGVAASLANISKLSPEAQAASDRLTDSQQKLNAAMDEYNNLLAKIKAANPTQIFLDATKNGLGANFDTRKANMFGGLEKLEPEKWAEHLKQYLSKSLDTKDIEGNVQQFIVNIRNIMAKSLSGNGPDLSKILEESFNFNSVNQKLNDAFAKLREEYIKGVNQLKDIETSKNGLVAIEQVLPGLKSQVEAAQKEFEALKNVTSSTPVNPEAFKGAEGAIAATNEATKMLGEAINKLDFSKINAALDQLADRLNKLVTELAGIEERMKTAFTGALEANVKSLGDVIDGLAKKMSAMSAPVSEGMKQGEQATNAQTEAIKKQEGEIAKLQEAKDRLTNQKHEFKDIEEMAEAYKKVEKQVEAVWNVINKFGNIGDKVSGLFMSGKDEFTKSLMHGDTGAFNKAIAHWKMDLSDVLNFLKEPGGSPGLGSAGERLENYISELKRMYEVLRDASSYGKRLMGSQTDPAAEQELRRRIELVEQLKTAYKETYSAVSKGGKAFIEYAHDDLYVEQAAGNAKKKAQVEKELIEIDNQLAAAQQKLNELRSQSSTSAEKQTQSEQQQAQATKELGQSAGQTAEQLQKLAQSTVGEAFNQLAASLNKIKELFDNLGKAEGLTQLNNTINGVNTAVEALAKTLSNVNNAVKFTGSTEEIAAYEAKVKSLQEQVAALEAKAKGLGETAKAASEQVKTVTSSGGGGSKEGLTDAQLKRVNDQLELLKKRLETIEPNYTKANKDFGFKDEVIENKINRIKAYIDALNEAIKAGSLSGIKVSDKYSLFSRAANEDIPTQAQAQKMAKQMQEYIAIQQQAQAEAERQAQAQERMRHAAEAAGMSIVKAGDQTQSAGQQSETAKQQMHGFNEEILVNMRSWEQAGKMMAIFEKRIFAVMAQLQSGKALGFDTGNLQTDIQELMRFYAIMREIRNNYGFAEIEGAMLTTSKVLKESGLDFGKMWEKNKQELTAVKTIYEQMMRLQALANNKNALPTDNLNIKYQREALENALRAQDIMAKLKSVDLRQATALVGGQDYQQATAAIEAFFRTYNQNANIAKSQTAELQRLLEKIQGTDKGGGWINVMKNAGVSEDKINEMRQIAEKIQRAIAALEQSRQMGTASNFVQSDWYRATVVEGKKANDTGYLAVREAHERAAAEREASKATQESAKAAEKKREEMSKAWREQEAARQKEAAAVEASMQKQMAAEEKARQKSIEDAWKAADQKIKADQHAAQERERANQQATKEEIKGYEQAVKAEYAKERAMSKRFAAEQEAARKAQQEKDKLYGAAGLRENDPGLQNMTARLDAFAQRIAQVREMVETFQYLISKGIGTTEAPNILREYEQELNTLMRQYEALYQARAALSAQVPFAETQRSVKNVELEQLGEKYRQEAKAADEAAKAKKRDAENSMAAGKAISDLQLKIDKYNKSQTFQKANELKIDTSDYERAIKRLERYKQLLEYIKSDAGKHHNPSLITGIGSSAENDVKRAEIALKKLVTEKQQAASAAQQLASEQQRLAQALNQTTESARGQSQVLSDLKMMATQYLGVWGAQQFLHNIIEIGGQLEMQRMSIGAILQNQSQANDLFEKIKGLAVQSPFGVVELDQMTKQLTAYGFKYSELFDMTKRLADISAATGTGVDRLALALGHVRSEAALSGYTLRQFSMGNVPLLQKLSEKLGKTTQEIRKMVRSKEISYEDVEGVIKDLTNEGGMFYNMQETISQSVKARFKNVKDAMDIMYGEMAEGATGDALKGVADALMEITKNWKDAATVIATGAALWATQRAAIMVYTSAIGKNNASVISSIAVHRQKEAAMLRNAATYRALTAAELKSLAASKQLTIFERIKLANHKRLSAARMESIALSRQQQVADLATALKTKKLTTEEILQQVAYGKVSKAQARKILLNGDLTASEKAAAMSALRHTEVLKGMALRLDMLGGVVRKAALALKSLVFNPAMLGMAAITALIELWQNHNKEMERAEEIGQGIYEQSQDAIRNTQTMLSNYTATLTMTGADGKKISDAQFNMLNFSNIKNAKIELPEFDFETAQQSIDEWIQYIQNYSANSAQILNKALFDNGEQVLSLTEQYENLRKAVSDVALAQYGLQDLGGAFESAIKSTNSDWAIDDDVITNIKEYANTLRNVDREIAKIYSGKARADIDKAIALSQRHSESFAEATKNVQSYGEAFNLLMKRYEEFPKTLATVNDFSGIYMQETNAINKVDELNRDRKAMEDDLQTFYVQLKAQLETQGVDLANMSENQQQALLLGYKKQLEQAGNLSDGLMKKLMIAFAQEFNIPINLDDAKFIPKIDEAKRLLGELVNGEWKVDLQFATNITNVIDEARKQYKAAKDFYANAEPVLLKFGVQLKIGNTLEEKQIEEIVNKAPENARDFLRQVLKGANEASKVFNQATEASKAGGFSLTDPNKEKKNKTKKSGTKSYKDPVAEEWKERIRLLKDANSLYKEWNNRTGEDAALNRVREQYGDIFKKWRTDKNVPWKDFKAEDIIEYRKYVQKIVDEAQKRYDAQRNDKAKNYGKEAEAVLREGKKLLDDIDKYDFDEKAREFKTAFDKALDDMTRRWEIFTSVRNATGNKLLAFNMANIGQESRNLRNAADAMKDKLADEMQRVGGEELLTKIPFSVDIDEEKLRDQFKAALGDSEKYATTIDGLVEAYKKWQKLQQDVVKSDIDVFAKLMGSVVSYSAQIRKINDELAQQKTAIANSGASASQQQEATAVAESQADWKKMKLSADYSNLYNKTIAMSRIEFERAADAVQNMIDKLRDLGTISPDEYLQEVEKLNKARMEWSTTGFLGERGAFGQFISGGNQGLMDYYQQRAEAARRRADYLKDTELVPGAAQKNARAEAEYYQKLYESLKKLTDEAQKVITAFQTLQNGIDLLGGLFDSLGMEGAANAMSDAGGILGGALQGASSLSALGPYGMAAGAAIGIIGGIAQVHDKALERHINKLREDVKGIEANTELIARSRERTLGYDMGDVRRQMAQQYATQSYSGSGIMAYVNAMLNGSRQNKSMYEYYSQNSQGTGYQQEYDNLVEQREKYLEILKDQQDKKKKSNDEIEETKAKIAELDDQIAYFTQDLAKELWSIDIKGWADQLSDALASAFENGENMAKAYRDTVTQIIQQMMQKMMQIAILEPMFERLQKQLFGENGKGGVFDPNNPKGSMSKVTAMIGDFFGKGGEGEKAITASMEFMTAFQRGMQNAGLTVLNEASNTLSSGIQGTSEETSGLLAGYVNALRQDVSVNRILLTQFVSQMWPDYMETFANQVTAVQNIDSNVQVIMMMMQTGSGAMYDEIAALRARIDNVVLGIDKFSIR